MGRRRAATVVIACVLTGCASARHHDPGTGGVASPPRAVIAAAAPSSTTSHACLLPDASSARAGSRPVTVGADPTSVRAVWFRGFASRCAEPITHAGKRTAALLAHDIRSAKPYPPGRYSCPADFGRAVELFFAYPRRPTTQAVVVTLTGCAGIVAPGRGPKLQPGRLIDDLRPITPPDLLRQPGN